MFAYTRMQVFQAALTLTALAGCSGTAGFSEGKKSDGGSKSGGSSQGQGGDGVSVPQPVSGSFLTCIKITDQCGTAPSPIGCVINDGNGAKLDLTGQTLALQLFDDQNQLQAMKATAAPDGSPYHLVGSLPADACQTGYVKATASSTTGSKSWTEKTSDISSATDNQALGTTQAGATIAAGLALSDIPVDATWSPGISAGDLAFATGITPGDFCSNGQIPTTMNQAGLATLNTMLANSGVIGAAPENITVRATTVNTVHACLKKIGVLGHGSDYSQSSNGCYFFRQDDILLITSQTLHPNLGASDVEAYATYRSSTCP
jgi:hypothetical protein